MNWRWNGLYLLLQSKLAKELLPVLCHHLLTLSSMIYLN